MYICLCNPFSDKDVQSHLETLSAPTCVYEVYKTCSGGANFNCGSCACMLKEMVDTHNNAQTGKQISAKLINAA